MYKFIWSLVLSTFSLSVMAAEMSIAKSGSEGQRIIVNNNGSVLATYQGSTASFNNTLFLMLDAFGNSSNDGNLTNDLMLFNDKASIVGTTINLGTFKAGTELEFRLQSIWSSPSNAREFYSGDAARNPDGDAHARVQTNWQPGTTLVSFEDLLGGPFQFNDMSFSFTNTMAAPVPEESTLILSMVGLVMLGVSLRRKSMKSKPNV